MSASLFARKAVMCWSLSGLCTSLLTAQTAFVPFGNEQLLTGATPGDPSNPHAAISAAGGFAVWSDNATDGDGMGIRAQALDTRLQPAQPPFRVNTRAQGDQEDARVVLLGDGGAAFFWRSETAGTPRVVARFLSPTNGWLTQDLPISGADYAVRTAPSVTVLTNGNAVVVWSAFGQRSTGSMDDVYGQVISPTGARLGTPFTINQFSTFNQRTPSVAALPDGGFVVVWASDQQRQQIQVSPVPFVGSAGDVTVDVCARVFDQNGSARTPEFFVNTNLTICANPAVAAGAGGGFLVAWSKGSPENPDNTWDVLSRAFSPLGIGGATVQLNGFTKGRQYAPQVAVLNDQFLIAWISGGQDGSRRGVYARYAAADGTPSGPEFRVNSTVMLDQDQPAVAADQVGRFMAVWRSAFSESRIQVDLFSQTYALPGFEPLVAATNYSGPAFVDAGGGTNGGDTNAPVSDVPVLDYPVIPSGAGAYPIVEARGSYRGLIYNKDGVRVADSGYVTAVASASGGYTVNLRMGQKLYSFAGKFGADGKAVREIRRVGKTPLTLSLSVDLTGTDQLKGTLVDGQLSADFLADKLVYHPTMNPCTNTGRFNAAIEPPDLDGGLSAGSGYGTFTISKGGRLTFVGRLADGSVVSQSSAVSRNGTWPLYAAPYAGRGRLLSWVQTEADSAEGKLVWIKPAGVSKVFPSGFSTETEFKASRYSAPQPGQRALDLPEGIAHVTVSGGGLVQPLQLPVFVGFDNRVADASGSGVRVTISPAYGSFLGRFVHPSTGAYVSFGGRLLQGENGGVGYFISNNLSGLVTLSAPMQ